MGWLCPNCGAENDFQFIMCEACGTHPEKKYLMSELAADRREHKSRITVAPRKISEEKVKRIKALVLWANAMLLFLLILCFSLSVQLFFSQDYQQQLSHLPVLQTRDVGQQLRHVAQKLVQTLDVNTKKIQEGIPRCMGIRLDNSMKNQQELLAEFKHAADVSFFRESLPQIKGILSDSVQLLSTCEQELADRFVSKLHNLIQRAQ